jgi:type I restriction enzyme S subunit
MKDLNEKSKFVYPSAKRKLSGGSRFQNNDTLFARITPCLENGKICQVKNLDGNVGFGSTEFFVFRGKEGISDNEFVFYLSRHDEVRRYAEKNMLGTSGRQRVPRETFDSLELDLPPLPTQRRIADILSALDEKIELNRQTNATLEAIAQAIFKEWFVENEDADKWDVIPLSKIISLNPPRPLRNGNIAPYLDMANMPTKGHRAIEWRDRPFGSGTKFINGDTLLARITPCLENGKTAFVDFLEDGQTGWGSTEYIVFRPKPPLPPEYGYYLARTEDLRNHVIQNMIGTSGRQRASASCLDSFMIAMPPAEIAIRFGKVAKVIMAEIKTNDEAARTLAALRDTLLPKLMGGEVSVLGGVNE